MMRAKACAALLLALVLALCGCAREAPPSATAPPEPATTAAQAEATAAATTAPQSSAQSSAPDTTAAPETTISPETEPPTTAAPTTSAPATEPPLSTCTLTVTCKTALESGLLSAELLEILPENGIILHVEAAELREGDTVFDLLQRECRANKIHMEFVKTPALGTAYIEGIGNLYELDCGELSGWVYTVDDEWPGYGCSNYVLSPGEHVEWLYTCDLGRDVGAPDAELGGS